MKKLALSITMILIAASSVLAGDKVPAKKAVKKENCGKCAKGKCGSSCSSSASTCVCK